MTASVRLQRETRFEDKSSHNYFLSPSASTDSREADCETLCTLQLVTNISPFTTCAVPENKCVQHLRPHLQFLPVDTILLLLLFTYHHKTEPSGSGLTTAIGDCGLFETRSDISALAS